MREPARRLRPDIPVSVEAIAVARARIADLVAQTPLVVSGDLAKVAGESVMLKMEAVRPTGSFKIRGAASKILGLPDRAKERGVVTRFYREPWAGSGLCGFHDRDPGDGLCLLQRASGEGRGARSPRMSGGPGG